jgi:hypothetical protein
MAALILISNRARGAFVSRRPASITRVQSSVSVLWQANCGEPSSLSEHLTELDQEIVRLNGGSAINLNSPKQVSVAIFGSPQRATKSVLERAAAGTSGNVVTLEKQQLAKCILEYRELAKQQQTREDSETVLGSKSVLPETMASDEIVEETATAVQFSSAASSTSPVLSETNQQSHDQLVESFYGPGSQIDPYWRESLLQLSKSTSRALLNQLDPKICPMGYDPTASPKGGLSSSSPTTSTAGKKGTFLAYCRRQKELYPHCVLLVRCGDFYETFGLDAILLVEHVGLNSMAGKCKAGCPHRNIQATLVGLTQQGFSVAVYEEVADTSTTNKKQLKTRLLTQIVSPAAPTYLYDNWLLGEDRLDGLPPSRPCIGIVSTASGYTVVEVSMEERSVRLSERLTPEAVACRLAAYPPADPLLFVPSPSEYQQYQQQTTLTLPFLPTTKSTVSTAGDSTLLESSLAGFRIRTKVLPPALVQQSTPGMTDTDRYTRTIVEALLQMTEQKEESEEDPSGHHKSNRRRATVDDFQSTLQSTATTQTNPLYVETATQLGLLNDKTIPDLVSYLLDNNAPAATRRFLQRYLLIPPPPVVAQSMACLVSRLLQEDSPALPPLAVPPLGKVLALMRAGQASARVYGELLQTLHATGIVLQDPSFQKDEDNTIQSLMVLLEYESGLSARHELLAERCREAVEAIEAVVSPAFHVDSMHSGYDPICQDEWIPAAFLERNEAHWRGRVQPEAASQVYYGVEEAASKLGQAILDDFIGTPEAPPSGNPIVQDVFNNLIALKERPPFVSAENKEDYFHPRDRHGKILTNRYTTSRVQAALNDYVEACEQATEGVSSVLSNLAEHLHDKGHMPAIVQSAHLNLILSTAFHHASKATQSGWHLAETFEPEDDADKTARFVNLWPYWMHRSQAVANTFDLQGLFLLTAPNMSGKSTLMRSTAAATLLTICGICAPVHSGSRIPRLDTLFLRGASSDVPAENKSAFGAEMGDIAALMRCCGPRSFVFVDELGRGTSPKDGTRLAGAVLEAMAKDGMSGIFATHLHDILQLPLEAKERISTKRMAIEQDEGDYDWTYRLEDGVCTDSLALVTAARFGLPEEIIRRAEELADYLPEYGPSTKSLEEDTQEEEAKVDLKPTQRTPTPTTNGNGNGNRRPSLDFLRAIALAEDLTGQQSITIPPRWFAPASMGNKSCVYVLELPHDPPRYYVGETDSLPQRLRQHRKKGGIWAESRAAAFSVESKTQARGWESLLIQKLAQSGFALESISDGRSLRRFKD